MKRSWARSYYNYASCAVNFGTCFLTDGSHFFFHEELDGLSAGNSAFEVTIV